MIPFILFLCACCNCLQFDFPSNAFQFFSNLTSVFDKRAVPSSDAGLDGWIAREEGIALDRLVANIAGSDTVSDPNDEPDDAPGECGARRQGALTDDGAVRGTVIASPSKSEPDYFFTWTRDAAITIGALVRSYNTSDVNVTAILDAYVDVSYDLQHLANPSGTYDDELLGLGEPKFLVSGNAFTGPWGRPQRDGPALRALTLIRYLRVYNASHSDLWATRPYGKLYDSRLPTDSVIKADLEYVSHQWSNPGFDLWEEVEGMHFFTSMMQLKALKEGAGLATVFGDTGAAEWYAQQAAALSDYVQGSFDNQGLKATVGTSRSGVDCSLILGSLYAFEDEDESPGADEEDGPFSPWSDAVLNSTYTLIKDAAARYSINNQTGAQVDVSKGVAVGRYPEDVYDGCDTGGTGNPWFLCTSAVAQLFYMLANHYQPSDGAEPVPIVINEMTRDLWTALNCSLPQRADSGDDITISPSDQDFKDAISCLKKAGDAFLNVVRLHAHQETGAMSEQIDRETGFCRGARDLTWSYGAFLEAARWRRRIS